MKKALPSALTLGGVKDWLRRETGGALSETVMNGS
jgi:hypothetical protein